MIPRRNRRAFSIVELTIAFGILIIGVYAIYEQFIKTRQLGQRQFSSVQGRMLAQQKLAELMACRYDDLAKWKPGAEFKLIESNADFYQRAELSRRPGDNGLNITVTVGWNPSKDEVHAFSPGNLVSVKGVRFP